MKTLLALLLLLTSAAFAEKDDIKYGHWLSDSFITCPNLFDALNKYELLSHQVVVNEVDVQQTINIYLIRANNEIYKYITTGIFEGGTHFCHKLFRNQDEALSDEEIAKRLIK